MYSYLSAKLTAGCVLSEIQYSFDSQNAYHKKWELRKVEDKVNLVSSDPLSLASPPQTSKLQGFYKEILGFPSIFP